MIELMFVLIFLTFYLAVSSGIPDLSENWEEKYREEFMKEIYGKNI